MTPEELRAARIEGVYLVLGQMSPYMENIEMHRMAENIVDAAFPKEVMPNDLPSVPLLPVRVPPAGHAAPGGAHPSKTRTVPPMGQISDELLDDWYARWPSTLPTSVPHEQVKMLIEDVRTARIAYGSLWKLFAQAVRALRRCVLPMDYCPTCGAYDQHEAHCSLATVLSTPEAKEVP